MAQGESLALRQSRLRLEHELPMLTRESLEAFLALAPADAPLRPAAQAVRDRQVQNAELLGNHEEILSRLDQALTTPQLPSAWRIVLLNLICQQLLTLRRNKEADRITYQLDDLITANHGLAFQLIPIRNRLFIARNHRDVVMGDAALNAAEELLRDHPQSDAALEFRVQRLAWRNMRHDFQGLAQDWRALESLEKELARRIGVIWVNQYAYFCAYAGRNEEITHLLSSAEPRRIWRLPAMECLVATGRCDEAEGLIRDCKEFGVNCYNGINFASLLGEIALLRNDDSALRRQIQQLQRWAEERSTVDVRLTRLAIQLSLRERQPRQAMQLLERIDPNRSFGDCHVEWARAFHLLGDGPAAARQMAIAMAKDEPNYIDHRLRFARELRPDEVLRLWRSALKPEPVPTTVAVSTQRRATEIPELVGESPALCQIRERLHLLADRDEPVLVTGETGTGKEIATRHLHVLGRHASRPLLSLNCAALPESVAENELFGHVRGAFTGADRNIDGFLAAAAGGTIFLDEICSLPLRLQGLLLRVLETGDYLPVGASRPRRLEARIVAASNRPLPPLVESGAFRQDLYYRIHRLTIALPPLRERHEDIPLLVRHFLGLMIDPQTPMPRIADDLWSHWASHSWPGNIRELRNEVEGIWVLHGREPVWRRRHSNLLPQEISSTFGALTTDSPASDSFSVHQHIPGSGRAYERRKRIIALLNTRSRTTQKEVIEHLGCATNTARSDLQALIDAGLLQRVITSRHLSTAYFVLVNGEAKDSESEGRGPAQSLP